jgi:two-component system chemotaxis sensor kinase CheA
VKEQRQAVMAEDQEIIKEFLIESTENLALLERALVELEQRPRHPELLAIIFRTIHTIKGTCGFLAFSNLESITHIAENILSQLRNGERNLTPQLTSLILETTDAIKDELASIEATSKESGETWDDLRRRLTLACSASLVEASAVEASFVDGGGGPDKFVAPVEQFAAAKPTRPARSRERQAATLNAQSPGTAETDEPAAPRPSADGENAAAAKAGSVADSTVRVNVSLLDRLMNLVSELVLARNQILQFNSGQDNAMLAGTAQRLNLITTQLQEGVMKTRMQPIGVIWNKMPRVVRDLAATCGKQILLEMNGAETELDRSIIEAVKDPLMHIVRNCSDHGIEPAAVRTRNGKPAQGRLALRAHHEGGQVNIEITDDGAGIDPARVRQKALAKGLIRPEQAERLSDREAMNLIFLPGFSTAEKITSISGRGVGMDIVKTNIEKIGGVVELSSRIGEGTTVKIKVPLTLAIIPGLVVSAGGEQFIVPQVSLRELVRLEGEADRKKIERVHGTPVYRWRGNLLPIVYLNQLLHLPGASDADVLNIVVLRAEDRQFGLVVDEINDTQEIVVKPLGKQLKGLSFYLGATIMGDGKVALILDALGVGRSSGVLSEPHEPARAGTARNEVSNEDRQSLLLFRAGKFARLAVPLTRVARLEEFPASRIERAAGKLVVQYRGRILELIQLSSILQGDTLGSEELSDPAQVIVFAEGDHMTGLVVDQILDIHDENISVRTQGDPNHAMVFRQTLSDQSKLCGSAVIGGKVTDFLDLAAVLRGADENWVGGIPPHSSPRKTVLIADRSDFCRGLARNYLELAGHSVMEAGTTAEALGKLEMSGADVVIMSPDLPSGDGKGLAAEMRGHPNLSRIPILALCNSQAEADVQDSAYFGCRADGFDRETLLESVERLLHRIEPVGRPEPLGDRNITI